jgi:CheY-like chemotaxis protein
MKTPKSFLEEYPAFGPILRTYHAAARRLDRWWPPKAGTPDASKPLDRGRSEVVASFGSADLIRHVGGQWEIRGGTPDEHSTAREWASVFQHDAAFTSTPRMDDALSPPARRLGRKRVLLVDDDATVRESLKEVLLAEGYCVIPAEEGQQAVSLAKDSAFDLVLLDLNMPVMNGWDTFEQLTREHPLLPVIIITARPNQVFTAASAGAGALMEKPMDIPTLLEVMRKLLAETAEQRLSRLAGKTTEFHYRPVASSLSVDGKS